MSTNRIRAGGPALLLALLAGATALAGCADTGLERSYTYDIREPVIIREPIRETAQVVERPSGFRYRPVGARTGVGYRPVAEEGIDESLDEDRPFVRRRTRDYDPGSAVLDTRNDTGDRLDPDDISIVQERKPGDMYGGINPGANSYSPDYYETR